MLKFILNTIRKNIYLEYTSYFLQNNIFNRLLNFSGSGNFQSKEIYDRYNSIYSNYLHVIENKSVDISYDDIIIDFGFGYSSVNSYEFANDFNANKVIAYDEFNVRQTNIDEKYIAQNFPNISNVEHVYGIENLSILLHKLGKRRYIVFSNAVFEHVWNLNDVFGLIDRFSISGSVHYHGIDLRCHNKFL